MALGVRIDDEHEDDDEDDCAEEEAGADPRSHTHFLPSARRGV